MSQKTKRDLVSQSAYAKERGFSRQYVNELIAKGEVPSYGPDKKVDPQEADALLLARRNPSKVLRRKNKPNVDPADDELSGAGLGDALLRAKLKHEQERGRLAELQRRRREDQLVEAAEVRAVQQQRAADECEALLNWPGRFAADIAAELNVDQRQVVGILARYIRLHLRERSSLSSACVTPLS